MLRSRFVRPTSINTVRTAVTTSPLSPGVTTFHSIWTKKVCNSSAKGANRSVFRVQVPACVAGSFVFRVGKWAGEARKRMRRILLLPLVCPRFVRGFTAHLRERRAHQLHKLHVNLYQFYYFIWLLLVTKKQYISNRSLWPFFSASFLSLIYPWVFSAGFLYRGYSATCKVPDSTSSLMTPQSLDFSNLRRLILPERNCSRGKPFLVL